MKKIKLNKYWIGLFENRLVYMGSAEAPISAGDSEDVKGRPEKDTAESADTESAEKKESVQSGPTPTAEQAKRNMTRTHAKRVSDRLKTIEDKEAKEIAAKIDAAYSKSVTAEVSHDKTGIAEAMKALRSRLLTGEAILNKKGEERSSAEKYAQRELGLEEDMKAKKKAIDANKKVVDEARALKEKYEYNLTAAEIKEISNKTSTFYQAGVNLFDDGDYEGATAAFNTYLKDLESKLEKKVKEVEEEKQTPEAIALKARNKAEKALQDKSKSDEIWQVLLNGDAQFRSGNYVKAQDIYKSIISKLDSSRLDSAAVMSKPALGEITSIPETVNHSDLLNELDKELNLILSGAKFEDMPLDEMSQTIASQMQAAFDQIADTTAKKLVLAKNSLNYYKKIDDDLIKISISFSRGGKVFANSEISNDRSFKDGNLTQTVDNDIQPEKAPNTINNELADIINKKIEKFKREYFVTSGNLEENLKKALNDYLLVELTPGEREKVTYNYNNNFEDLTDIIQNYECTVDIYKGKLERVTVK